MAYAFNDDKSKFDLDTLAGNMATIEVSPTVDNHDTGEYILYDNVLYEVISPIAAGESLVLGTNVRSINIGDQLKTLQDSVGNGPIILQSTLTNINVTKGTYKDLTFHFNLPSGHRIFALRSLNIDEWSQNPYIEVRGFHTSGDQLRVIIGALDDIVNQSITCEVLEMPSQS